MTKKIECQGQLGAKKVRVKIIRAPLVDTQQLRRIIYSRSRALVL